MKFNHKTNSKANRLKNGSQAAMKLSDRTTTHKYKYKEVFAMCCCATVQSNYVKFYTFKISVRDSIQV